MILLPSKDNSSKRRQHLKTRRQVSPSKWMILLPSKDNSSKRRQYLKTRRQASTDNMRKTRKHSKIKIQASKNNSRKRRKYSKMRIHASKGKLTVIQDDEKPITTPWNTNMDVKCGSWEIAAACFHISKNELQALNNGRGKYENDMVLQVPVTKWITDDQFKTWEGVVKNFNIIGGTAELFRINRNTINGTTPYTTGLSVYVPMRSPV